MKNLTNSLQYITTFLKRQTYFTTCKIRSATLYLMFKPFLKDKQSKAWNKLKDLGYKVLRRFPVAGLSMLQDFCYPIFINAFQEWLTKGKKHWSLYPIGSWIDSTKLGAHYGFMIPELKTLFDYVKQCYSKTHHLFILICHIEGKDYILDFQIYRKEAEVGTNKLAQEMFERVTTRIGSDLALAFKNHVRVALDGAWGNQTMLDWFTFHGYRRVTLKSGGTDRIVDANGQSMTLWEWERMFIISEEESAGGESSLFKPIDPYFLLEEAWYYREEVLFETTGVRGQLFLIKRLSEKHKKPLYQTLISPCVSDWHAHNALKGYLARWGIETTIRTNKQYLDIEQMGFHMKLSEPPSSAGSTDGCEDVQQKKHQSEKLPNISPKSFLKLACEKLSPKERSVRNRLESQLSLSFMGYMIIQWYRVDHTYTACTSLKEVMNRWQKLFDGFSVNAFQNLISGN